LSEKSLTSDANSFHQWQRKFLVFLSVLIILSQIIVSTPLSWGTPRVKTIRIGVISPFDEWAYYDEIMFKQIVEPEINEYIAKLPRNRFTPATQVEFIIESAAWDPDVNLEIVKQFHEDGVNLLIGGLYTYLASSSLDYVNSHDMIMISPGSTGTELSLAGDNLFRLVPDDVGQVNAIAATLNSKGVDNLVIIQSDDNRSSALAQALASSYAGTIIDSIIYPMSTSDYTEYLTQADDILSENPGANVLLLSLDEAGPILYQSMDYLELSSVEWFGTDGTAEAPGILDIAPEQAANVKLYSPLSALSSETKSSSKHQYMKDLFYETLEVPFGFYTACEIDAAWLLVLGVLETQRIIEPAVSGQDIVDVLPDIASRYYGYSGWCELNEAGDRVPGNYEIHGYGLVDGEPYYMIYGSYNTASDIITWYP
jgi:ABC-type branched-subunit amino acid transport system substrate-binding protein